METRTCRICGQTGATKATCPNNPKNAGRKTGLHALKPIEVKITVPSPSITVPAASPKKFVFKKTPPPSAPPTPPAPPAPALPDPSALPPLPPAWVPRPPPGYKGKEFQYDKMAAGVLRNVRAAPGGDRFVHQVIQKAVQDGYPIEVISPYHIKDGKGYFSVKVPVQDYLHAIAHIYGTFDDTGFYLAEAIDYYAFGQTYTIVIERRPREFA